VDLSKGVELGVLNSAFVRAGRLSDPDGHIHETTFGWGLQTDGLFRLMERVLPGISNTPFALVTRHFGFRYNWARQNSDGPKDGTEYREFHVSLRSN